MSKTEGSPIEQPNPNPFTASHPMLQSSSRERRRTSLRKTMRTATESLTTTNNTSICDMSSSITAICPIKRPLSSAPSQRLESPEKRQQYLGRDSRTEVDCSPSKNIDPGQAIPQLQIDQPQQEGKKDLGNDHNHSCVQIEDAVPDGYLGFSVTLNPPGKSLPPDIDLPSWATSSKRIIPSPLSFIPFHFPFILYQ